MPTDGLRGSSERPFPGETLAARVAGTADRDWFFASGERSVQETAEVLARIGRQFGDYDRILDFGAGCGRMTTWLEDVARGSELHATDTDGEAVAWMAGHLPFVRAVRNESLPPLPYPNGFFGLVYGHSVFTHLDEAMQDAWLAELARVTRPGGVIVTTIHGEHAFAAAQPDEASRARFDEQGIVFIEHSQPGLPDWYGVTYHAAWYVRTRWGRWLRLREHVPQGALGLQDMLLLSPRPIGLREAWRARLSRRG